MRASIGILFATASLAAASLAAVLMAAVLMATPATAQTADCDRLAASPFDPTRPAGVPGVSADQIDGPAAVAACTKALAADPVNPRIKSQLSRALVRANGQLERAFALNREAAAQGSLMALNNMASMIDLGQGTAKDRVEATRLFRQAAEQGLPVAMRNLGNRLANGIGTDRDQAEALNWYRKGASAGDAASMESIATAYAFGNLGLTQDDGEARRLMASAAAAGGRVGQYSMGTIATLEQRTPDEIGALQRRLIDAACYKGPTDGKVTVLLERGLAACPSQRPQLRVETGMHIASVKRIGVDARCSIAATASDDKTVRLWSLPEGRALRVLRWAIGGANDGKVYAVSISPDGRFVAAGGWNVDGTKTNAVVIFGAAGGDVVARIDGIEAPINFLAFSRDGRWLAAVASGGKGVRFIDTSVWRVVAADRDYGDSSNGAAFGPDGRLYTVSFDGKIRRYGPGPIFVKEAEVVARGGKHLASIAVDPAGERVAVGFEDSQAVDLHDAASLRFRNHADTKGLGVGDLGKVAWRSDGRVLIAAGAAVIGRDRSVVLFDRDGRRVAAPVPLAGNRIDDIEPCGAGFIAGAADPAFGLLDGVGAKIFWRDGVSADMRGKLGPSLTMDGGARRVRFGLGVGATSPVLLDLASATLTESPIAPAALAPAIVQGLPVTDWLNNVVPRFAGTPLRIGPYDQSRSLAIRPDRAGFILGTSSSLRAFNATGAQLWSRIGPSEAWGVNVSADGRLVVVAYGDGTIRWHRVSDGVELLAVFVNKATRAWVAWTPSGYYSASPGGEDMIGWHINRGWAQPADFFAASKFRDTYLRPDVVEKVLDTLDENEAVKQADAARPSRAVSTAAVAERLPPVVSILSPADGAAVGDTVRVDYLLRSPSGLPVDSVAVLIDGRPMSVGRGLERVAGETAAKQCLIDTNGLGRIEGALQGCRGSVTVTLPPGASEVGLFARSGDRSSDVAKVRLARSRGAGSTADVLKPKLYALVVGISTYQNHDLSLTFPAKDARDFTAALQNQGGGLYAKVEVRSIQDEKATAVAIRDGLDWLTKQVTSRDVGLVYLAGHGVLDERNRFYFLASDSDATRPRATALPRDDISDALNSLAGKALLFLDACHAGAMANTSGRRGAVDINTIVNDFSRTENGVVVFAASMGRQVSQESASWNNGAFTKAVVEGLGSPGVKGLADYRGDGKITTSELDAYVTERVKVLTNGEQSPVMIRPPTVPDFPLAVSR